MCWAGSGVELAVIWVPSCCDLGWRHKELLLGEQRRMPSPRLGQPSHPLLQPLTTFTGANSSDMAARFPHSSSSIAGWGMQCNHTAIQMYLFSLHFTFWAAVCSLLRHFTLSHVNSCGALWHAAPKAGIEWGVRLIAVGILHLKTTDTFLPQTDFLWSHHAKFVKIHRQAKKKREKKSSFFFFSFSPGLQHIIKESLPP